MTDQWNIDPLGSEPVYCTICDIDCSDGCYESPDGVEWLCAVCANEAAIEIDEDTEDGLRGR